MSEVEVISGDAAWSLAGVALGFGFTAVASWWQRKKRVQAHWAAVGAELEYCGVTANGFRTHNIECPLYRFPTSTFTASYPQLLADGDVSAEDSSALLGFFNQVQTLNRGLDQAQQARDNEWGGVVIEEHRRNMMKAKTLDPSDDSPENYYHPARRAIERHRK